MDRKPLWMFADACQIAVGHVERNPDASIDVMRDLLSRMPCAVDARAQVVIDGIAVRMLRRAHSIAGATASLDASAVVPPAGTTVVGGLFQFRVAEVLTYLEQRFADPSMRLSSAARHAGLSPSHLARRIKASTGLTFLKHLRGFRVQHADRLLLTTMLSIKEIAARCGDHTTGSFDRDFRRVHRCTPSVWRATHRRNGSAS